MTETPVRVVVAGGGTAGWIAATALVRQLNRLVQVTLIESDELGTIGVGEATIPTARAFHEYLRIDERSFMRATKATFKLGIEFQDWSRIGDHYYHSFGTMPLRNWVADFQHFWLQARAEGYGGELGDYYAELKAGLAGRFALGGNPPLNYAYHLDAGLYARFLRRIAENDGCRRVEGKIAKVEQHGESGDIAALVLESGERIEGDLFIDCTGFRSLLIEKTLGVGYEDWSHWLSNNGAWAVQTEAVTDAAPYTRALAHDAGWQWRIALQHRVGNGLVFSSDHIDPDAARDRLLSTIAGKPLTEPRLIRFLPGKRHRVWEKNCVALGLSTGFVEPLESTSIHLFMIGITRLIQLFPFGGASPALRAHYNRIADNEIDRVRDFVVLHFKLTERDDSSYWRACRDMRIPDSLRERIELFAEAAHAWQASDDLFRVDSWIQVMLGQRLEPRSWHQIARIMAPGQLRSALETARQQIDARVAALPGHQAFVDGYCGEPVPASA
jgi:tryptophan halogenase